jgi:hypothetical protein
MDEATQRDLAALADGSLEPAARDALLHRAAESPELADALARQRRAVAAVRLAAAEPAPDALRAQVEAMVAARSTRRHRPRRRVLAFGTSVAALAAAAVLVFAGGSTSPSVAEAAQVALAPARAPAPAARAATNTLDASVDGVAYPYWAGTTGWRATGSRSDTLHGRAVRTVFYENAKGQRLGYAIAAGPPLPTAGGTAHAAYRVLRSGGAAIVTWLRDGHTCILAARGVDASVLLRLAGWA